MAAERRIMARLEFQGFEEVDIDSPVEFAVTRGAGAPAEWHTLEAIRNFLNEKLRERHPPSPEHLLEMFDVGTAEVRIDIKLGEDTIGSYSRIIDDMREIEEHLNRIAQMDFEEFKRAAVDG